MEIRIPLLRIMPIIKAASPIAACKLPFPPPLVTAYLPSETKFLFSIFSIFSFRILTHISLGATPGITIKHIGIIHKPLRGLVKVNVVIIDEGSVGRDVAIGDEFDGRVGCANASGEGFVVLHVDVVWVKATAVLVTQSNDLEVCKIRLEKEKENNNNKIKRKKEK
jgi:hypothetical protein